MWRRRREKARTGAVRTDAGPGGSSLGDSHAPSGRAARMRRAWRVDRREEARVALTPPAEFSRRTTLDQWADVLPAQAEWPANGRLGRSMASVYCIRCGQDNPEGARFCSQCGTPLARRGQGEGTTDTTSIISVGGDTGEPDYGDESGADAATLDSLPAGTALLVVKRGPNAGSRFLLDSDLTLVGRHPDSDIFLDDVTVSRRHAEFYRAGSRFTVRDVGSLNGTYVNRERIEEMDLTGGDEVQVGKFRLEFLLGPRSQADLGGGGAHVGG
jgi:hypothetical protein